MPRKNTRGMNTVPRSRVGGLSRGGSRGRGRRADVASSQVTTPSPAHSSRS